jgi:hypothetical protein
MTEEQRRQQITQARQQVQQRPAAPAMSDAEAEQLAAQTQGLTQEQMIAIAMLGKMVSNDIGGIKKNAIGDSLKVTDVDMSKVMPSGIAKAMGVVQTSQRPPQPVQQPYIPQPAPQAVQQPALQLFTPPVVQQQVQPVEQSYFDPNQLEFDLNKQARYEDIINAIDKLENKVNMLTDKINMLVDANNKKKPKITNGTQAG